MTRIQRRILSTTCMSHGLIHVCELCVPPLLVLIQRQFAVDDFRMGQVVTVYGMLFGLGALPAGVLVDRLGSKALLALCLWGASASMLGMALAPTIGWFTLCAACMGLCLSGYHPAGTALITHFVPTSGRVFAIHGMAGSIGVASASAIAGALGAVAGWRWALVLLALPGLALGVRVLALPKPDARPHPSARASGHWRRLVLLLVAAGFMGIVYRGMTTFLPKLLSTTYTANVQTGTAVGGALTTAALLFGVVGMHTAGRISDSGRHPASVFLWGAALQAPLLVAMAYVGGPALFALAVAVAFFHFFTQPVGNQLVAQLTSPSARGLGYGLYFFVAFGAGSTGAALSGWVSDNLGLSAIFAVLAGVLAPAVLAVLPLRGCGKLAAPPPQPQRDPVDGVSPTP